MEADAQERTWKSGPGRFKITPPHPSFCHSAKRLTQLLASHTRSELLKLLDGAHLDKVEPLIACISTEYHDSLQLQQPTHSHLC